MKSNKPCRVVANKEVDGESYGGAVRKTKMGTKNQANADNSCTLFQGHGIFCTWRRALRAGLHHGPWSRIMEDDLSPWSDSMIQLSWSDFLKNKFIKPLGPSLSVNQMWIKKNDHAPKSACVDFCFFYICPKMPFLKKKFKFDHSLAFYWASLLCTSC